MINWLINNVDLCMAITSICSMIIAMMALILSLYSSYSQIKFSKKSVIPICNIVVGDYEECLFVKIMNVGLGTMIIDTVKCTDLRTGRIENILVNLLPDVNQKWEDFSGPLEKFAFSAGHEVYMMKICPQNDKIRNQLRKCLRHICINVEYRDLYNKTYVYSQELDFFGRLLKGDKD